MSGTVSGGPAGSADDEAARVAVVRTAGELFNARGIQAVGIDELRAASGISLKRLYQLFGSKEAIVKRVLAERHQYWSTSVQSAVQTAGTRHERLLAVYDFLAQWFDDDSFRGCFFINTFGELGGMSPEIGALIREHKTDFQRYLADLVTEVGGPVELAAQLAILAEGAQTTAAIAGTSEAAGQARRAAQVLIDSALIVGTLNPVD